MLPIAVPAGSWRIAALVSVAIASWAGAGLALVVLLGWGPRTPLGP